jgi:Protein of unknown function (DUF3662)/FHA domain
MNPLKTLETMLANLVEGTFGRLFRSEVRPMELARRLTREMDEHRTQSVSRVYAPNEYAVWLSPEDRALYEGVEEELIEELCAYLLEHARRENLMLASPPQIAFHTDEQLTLGEFGIEARLVRPEDLQPAAAPSEGSVSEEWLAADEPVPDPRAGGTRRGAVPTPDNRGARRGGVPPQPEAAPSPSKGETMTYSRSERIAKPLQEARARRPSRAMLLVENRRVLVPPPGAVVGRSRECDIVLEDVGVSRRHAEIRPTEDGWLLVDLGSTNGVRVNGRALRGKHQLQLGDRIELGTTELVFEVR